MYDWLSMIKVINIYPLYEYHAKLSVYSFSFPIVYQTITLFFIKIIKKKIYENYDQI